ncbi:hypothetical protein [Streptomyces glomeratus]|nr:hypothetical protein [Streptomyces glomeratus]MCF1507808.1 hypothetical protein [Streptomyces glomeratus]
MPWVAVPAVVLLVGLAAGCARDQGTAAPAASSSTPSASAGARQDTQQDMERKVAAAESALSAADRDAAQDGGR